MLRNAATWSPKNIAAGAADGHVVGARLEGMDLRVGLRERHVGHALLGGAAAGVVEHA